MEYVMVPVPEELAEKVLTYVSWKNAEAKARATPDERPDDGEAMARAFARLDEVSRALITVIAAAALEAEELSVPEAARRAGVSTREALGILLEANSVIAGEGGPPLGFSGRDLGGSADEFTWDSHLVVMAEAIAGPILDLARSYESD